MSKKLKYFLLFTVLMVVFWWLAFELELGSFNLILYLAAIAFTMLSICFLVLLIAGKIAPKLSAYTVFAIAITCVTLAASGYAFYDIATDTGWFAGLLGALILMFVVPTGVVLLIIDIILMFRDKKKRKKAAVAARKAREETEQP